MAGTTIRADAPYLAGRAGSAALTFQQGAEIEPRGAVVVYVTRRPFADQVGPAWLRAARAASGR